MPHLDRRVLLAALVSLAASQRLAGPAFAQKAKRSPAEGQAGRFGYDDVVDKARKLASTPFDLKDAKLPPVFENLNWDQWRQIRFRPDRALLRTGSSRFSLTAFHLGHLFKRPVTINVTREGITTPIPYSTDLFDYGRLKVPKQLPIGLGFAGFRIHYPLNDPHTNDELISFVGSSYFRPLGRHQKYGLSARGLAINTGLLDNNEEFPFFREFWIDTHDGKSNTLTIFALLDSPSVTGAYHFEVTPGDDTVLDVSVTLFPRRTIDRLGMAPLTSMYFLGENDRHLNDRNKYDEFRPELHDSDGLLIYTSTGEWVWRPLKNPLIQEMQHFEAKDVRGFGLMQRDRRFDSYQDIELMYEQRPSYWIEPKGNWGDGVIELVELATKDETADNIVCAFLPKAKVEPGEPFTYGYKMHSLESGLELHNLGHALNTFSAPAGALGSGERSSQLTRRLMIDFVGGEMGYYMNDTRLVQLDTTAAGAKVLRSFVVGNPAARGIRVMVDVEFEPDKVGVIRAALKSNGRTLTETWTYAWRFYNF
ncbi:MAG: glucan biosynthesis protein [Hyphomicrobiaceae bacterium]